MSFRLIKGNTRAISKIHQSASNVCTRCTLSVPWKILIESRGREQFTFYTQTRYALFITCHAHLAHAHCFWPRCLFFFLSLARAHVACKCAAIAWNEWESAEYEKPPPPPSRGEPLNPIIMRHDIEILKCWAEWTQTLDDTYPRSTDRPTDTFN